MGRSCARKRYPRYSLFIYAIFHPNTKDDRCLIINQCIHTYIYYFYYLLVRVFSHQRYYYFTLWEFFTQAIADSFHRSSSDCNSPQVFTTRLNILGVLNNAVVWMVSTRPLISKSSSPFTNPLVTVPRVPITIGITVTFMFQSFSIP